MELKKASRKQAKLRIGLSGPSGSGKTYSALQLAYGLCGDWNKIALIDTENGSGDLYSHLGDYNTLTLEAPFSPERYIQAIKSCEDAGMEVIIIDSITHEWEGKGGCLEINDSVAIKRFKGNSFMAWSVTGPLHQSFIDSILQSNCHIITTVRNKIEMVQTDDGNGKKSIKKIGTKEITREGFEYELTINFSIDRFGHYATASKDRTNLFIDKDPFVLTSEIGQEIKNWNLSGEKVKPLEEIKQENYVKYFELLQKVSTLNELKEVFMEVNKLKDKINNIEELSELKDKMKESLTITE